MGRKQSVVLGAVSSAEIVSLRESPARDGRVSDCAPHDGHEPAWKTPCRGHRRPTALGLVLAIAAVALSLAFAAPALAAGPAWELTAIQGPTNVPLTPGVNEVYALTVSGNAGRWKLNYLNDETEEEGTTKLLAHDATAEEVQEALEKLKEGDHQAIGAGNVKVTGGPVGEAESKYVIEFVGGLAGRDLGEPLTEETEEPTPAEEKKLEKEGREEIEVTPTLTLTTRGSRDTVIYQLIPRNTGASPTAGKITIKDKLPSGFTTRIQPEGQGWNCERPESKAEEKQRKEAHEPPGAGFTAVECTSETVVNADATGAPITVEAFVDTSVVKEGSMAEDASMISGGGVATAAETTNRALIDSTPAPFGMHNVIAGAFNSNGESYTQAGGHPYAVTTGFFFNTVPTSVESLEPPRPAPPGNIKDVDVKLPAGFVGNPQAAKRCTQAQFTSGLRGAPEEGVGACPTESQVGTVSVYAGGGDFGLPADIEGDNVAVYNLMPPAGVPAEFGFIFKQVPIRLDAHVVREGGEHGEYRVTVLSADVNEDLPIYGVVLSLWGVPGESSHNAERFENETKKGVEDKEGEKPFLTNPMDCVAEAEATEAEQREAQETKAQARVRPYSPVTTFTFDSWQAAGQENAQGDPSNPSGEPNWHQDTVSSPRVTGCDRLSFDKLPSIEFAPTSEGGTTQADEPSGYTFKLSVPQNEAPHELASPQLKNVSVTLPQGVSVSPAGANGLVACAESGGETHRPAIELESTEPGSCPEAAQIGKVKIKSPLLENELEGRVYIGEPECSPCSAEDAEDGRVFKLFIEAEGDGVRVKLPGTASLNQSTGQMTTTFQNNPQLPFETLVLTLKNGQRSPLANPQTCGGYATGARLTPWSLAGTTPLDGEIGGTAPLELQSTPFDISFNGLGEGCPASAPFDPALHAGTENSTAGAYSNFDVTFERRDREQDLSGITVQTPPGLLGKIAGVTRCAEPQAAAGTCPASSQIGTATSAAGAGTEPYVVSGPVYLTNGYKGAPFGLSIVVPAKAGPFNLGTVIVRAAINVNPVTSAISITSDPLPQSIDGVPFRLKVVKVDVNRSEFMFNPTNCEGKSITAALTGAPVKEGEAPASVEVSAPFTASACAALPFKPVFTASTQGKTSKADGASLTVRVAQKHGEANIHKVEVQLPNTLPARLTTLQHACTEAQFNANPAGCPEQSDVGYAKAVTPLLSAPLEGPAYLVSHGNAAFPDLEFLLQGEGVHITLDGKTDIKKEITYSKFETVPDAPISSFETVFPEGPHSVLSANGNLCDESLIVPTTIVAQNNAQITQKTKVAVSGCPPKPTVAVSRTKIKGNRLLVTVKTSALGTVKISGTGLGTTVKRGLKAGTHQIGVPLTKAGRAARSRHRKLAVHVSLTVGSQSATKTLSVRA
jgi:hypothetical protein